MITTKGKEFFESIKPEDVAQYMAYWQSVAPKNEDEHYQRWLFAYMSVHTTWKNNVRGYQAIKRFKHWENDKDKLFQKIEMFVYEFIFQDSKTSSVSSYGSGSYPNTSTALCKKEPFWPDIG